MQEGTSEAILACGGSSSLFLGAKQCTKQDFRRATKASACFSMDPVSRIHEVILVKHISTTLWSLAFRLYSDSWMNSDLLNYFRQVLAIGFVIHRKQISSLYNWKQLVLVVTKKNSNSCIELVCFHLYVLSEHGHLINLSNSKFSRKLK